MVDGPRTWTRRARGNLFIRQLVGGGSTRVKTGETNPIQGWISRSYGQREPAPVIEQRATGTRGPVPDAAGAVRRRAPAPTVRRCA